MQHGPGQQLTIAGHVYKTDDVHAANAYISTHVASHRLNVLDRGAPIEFNCRRWTVGGLQVCDFSYGRTEVEVQLERSAASSAFFLVLPLSGRATIYRGKSRYELAHGSAMVFSTNQERETRFLDSTDFRNLTIRFSAASVSEFLAAEFFRPLPEEIVFGEEPVVLDTGLRHLVEYSQSISGQLEDPQSQSLYACRHLARHTHDLILSLLLASMPSNYLEAYRAPAACDFTPAYIRKAEEYMRSHARHPLGMAEVARAVGVASRTLQLGFHRYRNYGAFEFLRNERLALARQDLLTAARRQLSVTDIAFSCGFVHLSRFAAAYQRRYGEKPSDTLRTA